MEYSFLLSESIDRNKRWMEYQRVQRSKHNNNDHYYNEYNNYSPTTRYIKYKHSLRTLYHTHIHKWLQWLRLLHRKDPISLSKHKLPEEEWESEMLYHILCNSIEWARIITIKWEEYKDTTPDYDWVIESIRERTEQNPFVLLELTEESEWIGFGDDTTNNINHNEYNITDQIHYPVIWILPMPFIFMTKPVID